MSNVPVSVFRVEAVVAMSTRNYAIGKTNTLPWKIPSDMARFKAITSHHVVLMGTKTALSIGRVLPNRVNLVLTRSGKAPYSGQIAVASMDEAIRVAKEHTAAMPSAKQVLYVIGGEAVYREAIPYLTGQHVTLIDVAVPGADAFWPQADFVKAYPQYRWHRQLPQWETNTDGDGDSMYMYFHLAPRQHQREPSEDEQEELRILQEIEADE